MWELWSDEARVVVYSKYTTAEGVATEREREYTYCYPFLSPPLYSIWTRPDRTQMLDETLQERVQQRKERPTHHKQQQKVPCQKHKNKSTKTCEKCDPMQLKMSCIQNTQQRKAWPQRGRVSTLTASHSCHRPRIPFGHVLIEYRCSSEHCKRGCKKKKEGTIHHKQQKKVPFWAHKPKITKRVRIVIRWNSSCRVQLYSKYMYTTAESVDTWTRGHREGESTLTA